MHNSKKIKPSYVNPSLSVSSNMAVVGSSGRLRDNPQGSVIDSFDDVVRFNRAPVKGFEEMVGSKTTIRALNSHVFRNIPYTERDWVQKNTYFAKKLRNTNIICYDIGNVFAEKYKHIHPSNRCYRIDAGQLGLLKEKYGFSNEEQLSLGFCFIAICIDSGIQPYLFGFDIEENRHRDHYWEKRGVPGPYHSVHKEKNRLKEFIKKNWIMFHG